MIPLPLGGTRSLSPTFVSARLVGLAVKLAYAFALCGWFPFSLSEPLGASVTFWEATAPVKLPTRHCSVPRSGAPLELKFSEAGIPLLAPPELTPELHSLPAILYTLNPSPMPRCSKAPRGLSVLPRVTCIFTGIAVSPSICPRQRPTRYAIRAGRNLPDKEFRYLRTVIVTAAVYRGFRSSLAALPLTFRHRAGVSPYTSPYGFAETCVFSKQSVGPLNCNPQRLRR